VSGPDSGQFRALETEVGELGRKVDLLSEAIVRAFAAAGVPRPPEPRPRLRVIEGGDGKP
jgi:hypothetical protein